MTVSNSFYVVYALAVAFMTANILHAEDGILVISVSDTKGRPIPGVVLSTKGDGETGSPTDISGKTRIRLSPQTRAGSWTTLQIIRVTGGRDLVFISPWDQRVIVPPFSNETENYVPVIFAEKGSRDVLTNNDALVALASNIMSKETPRSLQLTQTRSRRTEILKDAALEYGLDPDEVDLAIRSWSRKITDPYERGIASFYKGEFPEASTRLSEALRSGIKATGERQREAKIVDASFFLGRSLYEEGKYQEAANAFRQALQFREDDAELLMNLGLASVSIQSQAGTATQGGTIIQAQATTQYNYNYIATVQKEGTAGILIAKASSIAELQSLHGLINREAGAALGMWETQLRRFYEKETSEFYITMRVNEAVASARVELRNVQNRCADALEKEKLPAVKAQLFLLDGLASELAAKAGQSRPVSR